MKQSTLLIGILLTIGVYSCKKEQNPTTFDCSGYSPTYTSEIKSILDTHCAFSGCHNASSKADGKDYSTYAAAKSNAAGNNFLGSIQHLSGYDPMPRNAAKLSDSQIRALSCWKQNGLPE